MAVRFEVDAEQATKRLGGMRDRIDAQIEEGLDESAKFLDGKVKEAIRTRMRVRTGTLLKSSGWTKPGPRVREVGITRPVDGKLLEYAGIQHDGGVVKAKNAYFTIQNLSGKPRVGPFLRIPVGDGVTPAGVDRGTRAFYLKTKAGNYIGVRADGGKAELPDDIVAVLKSEVRIEGKHYVTEPVQENLGTVRGFIANRVSTAVEGQ